MNLFTHIKELLSKNEKFCKENELFKNNVVEAALKLDTDLIKLLLTNDKAKETFFIEIDSVMVFDKVKFQKFVSNKQFLPDSYTAFKNQIGLTANGEFLTDAEEVVLDFPYKDCILEGGQSKEDQKRKEIFWNETLASDDIDRLFEPKVFTNWKKYDKDGEHEVTDISLEDNLIIKGNNLITLHSLKQVYRGKIKLVYIDPPYNTGGDANTFAYNNTYNHASWLTFMKNRLEVAKELLTKDGVICIAIDDEEYAHLKILCDGIFKRKNYIGTIIVQSNPRGRTTNAHLATTHEYCLIYAKNKEITKVYNQPLTEIQSKDFDNEDENGQYRFLPFRRSGGTSTPNERPNSEFSLYFCPLKKKIIAIGGERKSDLSEGYIPKEILILDGEEVISIEPATFFEENKKVISILPIDTSNKRRVWRWSKRKEILLAAKNDDFKIINNNQKYTVQLKDRIKEGRKPKSIWSDSRYDASANGTMLLKKLFDGEKPFSYPKSLFTVKDTIQILTSKKSNDIILDFFGGSGTTAHAVLMQNEEDLGNRKFILCEQMDYIENVTKERVYKIIKNQFNDSSFKYLELSKWNENAKKEILECKDINDLNNKFDGIYKKYQIRYNVNIKKFKEKVLNDTKFLELPFNEQQQIFLDIIDSNQMYVNYSDMEDKNHTITNTDKEITTKFYNL